MSDLNFDQDSQKETGGFSLDFKRILSRAIRFWYVIVLSLMIASAFAFYKTRYTPKIYPVTASLLIRDTKEDGGAELLYKSGLADPYRNYLNEPYILRSYPLIEKVVTNLNFHISFYSEGYILTSEAYSEMPVKAEWCAPGSIQTGSFIFTLINEDQYTLRRFSEDKNEKEIQTFALNDSISFLDLKLCVKKIAERRMKPHIGVPYILIIQNPTQVATSYISLLKVEWVAAGSGIINLSVVGTNPDKLKDFLHELIIAYRAKDLEKKNEAAERTIAFITKQLLEIKDSLRIVEFQLERFGNKNRVSDISTEAKRLFSKVEDFDVQKADLLLKQNYYQYLESYLLKEERMDQVILPSSMGISDPILSSLVGKLVDLQLELKVFTDPESAKNPMVTTKINRIDEIRKDLEEAVRTLRATDKIKTDFLNKQLSVAEAQLNLLPASERQLIAVHRNYSLLENLYVFLMQKLSEAKITEAANTSDIIPVNPPMQKGAISPQPSQNYTIAIMVGLIVPLIVFVLFELLNNKVQSKEDVEKMSAIPFIGGIGHNAILDNLIVSTKPKSSVAESFRSLRSNLNYFTSNKPKNIFMISSSISGEGKTFTTINLATVFALSGRGTLIVGADMRRPKIFEDFKLHNDRGLSTYLSNMNTLDEVIQVTHLENLSFVAAGPVPPNPSELLLSPRFEQFIKEAQAHFDYILIDTPPLALVTDAFVISKFVDHTVFVVRQNYTPKEFIKSINEYVQSGKIKNISILLNDIFKSGLGYGYGTSYTYNYGYGYGYGSKHKKGDGYYEED